MVDVNRYVIQRAIAMGVDPHDVPDEIAVLVHMGYLYRVAGIEERRAIETASTIFRIHGEVFETVLAEGHPASKIPMYVDNVIRTHVREVTVCDYTGSSTNTITYS